jgi:hypothetical protein
MNLQFMMMAAVVTAWLLPPSVTAQAAPADSGRDRLALPWLNHPRATSGPIRNELGLAVEGTNVDTVKRRRGRAIELSEGYAVRLKIHQIGSYLELPIFAAELLVGQKLYHDEQNGTVPSGSLRTAHSTLAASLGILFGVNTVTGVWNLVEGWKDPTGRTRRVIHSLAMLAADAGFLATALTAPEGRERFGTEGFDQSRANTHRTLAISSSSVAAAATLMMWLWKG